MFERRLQTVKRWLLLASYAFASILAIKVSAQESQSSLQTQSTPLKISTQAFMPPTISKTHTFTKQLVPATSPGKQQSVPFDLPAHGALKTVSQPDTVMVNDASLQADLEAVLMYLRTGLNSGSIVNNPVAGQQYYVHFDYRNAGSTAANNFRLEIKLNGSLLCAGNVNAGANTTNTAFCSPAITWPSGDNTIDGTLDVNNAIPESDENNNTASRTYPSAADLVADNVYLRTGPNSGSIVNNPIAGQQYYPHFDWRNTGSTVANNFRLEFKLDGTVICVNNSQNANPNSDNTTWCSTAITWPSSCNTTLEGVLDANNVIAEPNESDNSTNKTFSGSAELVAVQMYLRTGPNSGSIVNNPVAGQQYYIHFDWQNTGCQASGFRLEIKLNGSVLCASNNQNAPANTRSTSLCPSPVTWPSGSNTIEGRLDVNGVIVEANENNNNAIRTYQGNPPTIDLTPTSFSFTATEGGSDPADKSLNIKNSGGGTLNWSASDNKSWLSLSPTSGSSGAGSSQNSTVSVNISGLAAGTYTGTITVSDPNASNSPKTASVTLTINSQPPKITLSPTSFSFTATQGSGNPSSQTLNIKNSGGGTLNWAASDNKSWLSLSPTSGSLGAGASQNSSVSVNIAGLAAGTYTGTITVSDPNASNSPKTASVTLTINSQPPKITLSPTSFSFTATQGSGNPSSQTLNIKNSGGGTLNWSANDNKSWLSLSPTSGSLGAGASQNSSVSVNIAGLAAGTYNATITVSDPNASNNPQTASVSLIVTDQSKPTIVLDPLTFQFSATMGSANPPLQSLKISNTGTALLNWTANVGQNWLSLSLKNGTVGVGGSQTTTLSVDITGLSSGTYSDTVIVSDPTATNSPQKATVILTVTPSKPTISLSPTSLQFTASEGGSNPANQTLNIKNSGGGTLNWSASDNASWLSLSPTSGSVGSGASQNSTVLVDITGLSAGTYNATITVSDPNASNSTQTAAVNLTIISVSPPLSISPKVFQFTAKENGSNPPSQPLSIKNSGSVAVNWTASDNANWLSLSPTNGSLPAGSSINVTVSLDITGLIAGTYNATITVSDPNASNNPQTASVTLTVNPPIDGPILRVEPEIANVLTGQKTQLDIMIEKAENLGSFEFKLSYDPAVVQIEAPGDVTLGPFLGSTGRNTLTVGPTIDNTAGTLSFGAFTLGTPPGPDSSGVLATIIFKAIASDLDTTDVVFTSAQITNVSGNTQPLSDALSGKIRVLIQCADVDSDCDVDVIDVQLVASRWNTAIGNPRYNPRFDLDSQCQGDGDIDVTDIMICAGEWPWSCAGSTSMFFTKAASGPPVHLVFIIGDKNPDGSFDLRIRGETTAELAAFQLALVLPQNWTVRDFNPGSLLTGAGNTVLPLQRVDDAGRFHLGAVSYGQNSGSHGEGVLARLKVEGDPQLLPHLLLESAQFADKNGEPLAMGEIDIAGEETNAIPTQPVLYPNYPNPFNPTTVIRFDLPAVHAGEVVELNIYNLSGQKIRELVRAPLAPGQHRFEWDGREPAGNAVVSGLYFYELRVGDFRKMRKMSLVK